jgi:phosphopantetheinyl transferase (holo-ACP synthase)
VFCEADGVDIRWAAKEAIIKAASGRKFYKPTPTKVGFHDILIWAEEHGPVRAAIVSEQVKDDTENLRDGHKQSKWVDAAPREEQQLTPDEYIQELDGQLVEISISHERDYAVATALIA